MSDLGLGANDGHGAKVEGFVGPDRTAFEDAAELKRAERPTSNAGWQRFLTGTKLIRYSDSIFDALEGFNEKAKLLSFTSSFSYAFLIDKPRFFRSAWSAADFMTYIGIRAGAVVSTKAHPCSAQPQHVITPEMSLEHSSGVCGGRQQTYRHERIKDLFGNTLYICLGLPLQLLAVE